MAVDELLRTLQQTRLNKQIINPLSGGNNTLVNPKLGINSRKRSTTTAPTFGSQVPDWLTARKSSALDSYMAAKSERTTDLAADFAGKAAGQVPVDKFGIVQDKSTSFNDAFNQQLSAINNTGKTALASEEAKAEWQRLQGLKEQDAGFAINWTPGASSSNLGAQAVSIAMSAVQNKTPYAWAGNSLTGGVDCSGLVQQVYKKLGINVPRSTYEQAKSGKRVSLTNLLPGDLVFFNTGKSDPNGIGKLSHVGIYIGNGQMIDARNSKLGIRVGSMYTQSMGGPVMAVRPW
jgi:Cell wall-associated hydrolases (invasion-associated proteins)